MSKIKDPSVKKKSKLPLHPFEIVWYILCGLVGIWGLTYIVLGTIVNYLPITTADNKHPLEEMDDKIVELFKLRVLPWGLIILAIAAVAVVVVLILFSNKVDRDYEKNVRRAQRLAQLEEEELKEEALEEQQFVDAEVEPVKEQPEEQPAEEAPVQEEKKVEEAPAEEEKPTEVQAEEEPKAE